jgi:rubredoxin
LCAYVHDPAVGDPDSGVKPGIPFSALPDGWVCLLCRAGKDEFEESRE